MTEGGMYSHCQVFRLVVPPVQAGSSHAAYGMCGVKKRRRASSERARRRASRLRLL